MSHLYLEEILEEISEEGDNARQKFGDQQLLSDLEWFPILAEEFGEVAMHITKTCVPPITNPELTPRMLREELLQVAAVSARWIRVLDSRPA